MKLGLRAFTLVELIVVITIVGILSTIGFVSYSWYLTGARDANRISQMTKLSDALQVFETTRNLPLPDNYINITASGTTVGYQGYVGVDVQEVLDFSNWGKDPKDDKYFTYYLSQDRSNFQLLAFMEEPESIAYSPFSQAHAVDYSDRFIKTLGSGLGVLTQTSTNIPAQEVLGVTTIDIVNEATNSYVANISTDEKIEGLGTVLKESIPNGSCKRLIQSGKGWESGLYTINPSGMGNISVYCDMEQSWGGWTLVARSATGATGNIGWGVTAGTAGKDSTHYSLGARTEDIHFSEIMSARYLKKKNIDYAVKFTVSDTDLDITSSSTFATSNCEVVNDSWLTVDEKTWDHCLMYNYWGEFDETDKVMFTHTPASLSTGLHEGQFFLASYSSTSWAWHGRQWMIFIK